MSRFKSYIPEQAYLLPPSVQDELSGDHLCFFLRRVVERLDLSVFERSYAAEGGALYAPELMLSVWLYAYATGITSARQLERRLVEDLPLRYLAAGARVDNWALSAFRRRHAQALNDCFTQVLEMARELGMGKLGKVAIDSTRIKASASRDKLDTEQHLRDLRAGLRRQVRRWQQMAGRRRCRRGRAGGGHRSPGEQAGRASAAAGEAQEERPEEALAERPGRAFPAHPQRLRSGLHGARSRSRTIT